MTKEPTDDGDDQSEPRLSPKFEDALVREAQAAFDHVLMVVRHIWPGPASQSLQQLHARESKAIAQYLRREPGLAKSVLDFWQKSASAFSAEGILLDLALISNLAAILSQLYAAFSQMLDEPAQGLARTSSRHLIRQAMDSYCDGSQPQVERLRVLCSRAVQVASGAQHVLLMEFPVGNSIPTLLIEGALRGAGVKVDVRVTALSRNDKRAEGVTREALIDRALSSLTEEGTELVLLADEWNTGANFAKLTKYIVRSLRRTPRVRFVPFALIAPGAIERANPAHIQGHDAIAKSAGLAGEWCRIDFPALPLNTKEPLPFFWAERDRYAGYRKMQLWGSLLSSLDAAVERLAKDRSARLRAYELFLRSAGQLPPANGVAAFFRVRWVKFLEIVNSISRLGPRRSHWFINAQVKRMLPLHAKLAGEMEGTFQRGLREYRSLREKLDDLDHPSNLSHPENVEVAYKEIIARLTDMVGSESDAAKCIGIAMYLERHEGGVDPADRFLFEKHVPVVWPLEGDERVLHEEFLAALMERTIGRE